MSIIVNRIPSAVSGLDSFLLASGPAGLSCADVLDRQLVGPAAVAHAQAITANPARQHRVMTIRTPDSNTLVLDRPHSRAEYRVSLLRKCYGNIRIALVFGNRRIGRPPAASTPVEGRPEQQQHARRRNARRMSRFYLVSLRSLGARQSVKEQRAKGYFKSTATRNPMP
jgi:hypothetical protein